MHNYGIWGRGCTCSQPACACADQLRAMQPCGYIGTSLCRQSWMDSCATGFLLLPLKHAWIALKKNMPHTLPSQIKWFCKILWYDDIHIHMHALRNITCSVAHIPMFFGCSYLSESFSCWVFNRIISNIHYGLIANSTRLAIDKFPLYNVTIEQIHLYCT